MKYPTKRDWKVHRAKLARDEKFTYRKKCNEPIEKCKCRKGELLPRTLLKPNTSTKLWNLEGFGGLGGRGKIGSSGLASAGVNPVIASRGHGIHAVLSAEVYFDPEHRRNLIEGWSLIVNRDININRFCVYVNGKKGIFCCRGSISQEDFLVDDRQIALKGGCSFDRANEGRTHFKLCQKFAQSWTLTGHSLGGGTARCVSESSGIPAITFNPAAPPTAPVTQPGNCTTYHIVFDVISAWISGGTVIRIDTAFRPNGLGVNFFAFLFGIGQIAGSHFMTQFFVNAPVIPAQTENQLWQSFWANFPFSTQLNISSKILGKPDLFKLPQIK